MLERVPKGAAISHRVTAVVAVAAVLGLLLYLIAPFSKALFGAVVLVYVTWPLHLFVRERSGFGNTGTALAMTALVTAGLLGFLVPLSARLIKETKAAFIETGFIPSHGTLGAILSAVGALPAKLGIEQSIGELAASSHESVLKIVASVAGGVTQSLLTIALVIFTSFFVYRDGEYLARNLGRALLYLGGVRAVRLLHVVRQTIRGTVYGAVITAVTQGTLAGLGFYVAGAPLPALLGVTTMVLSFIPFGAPLVYLPVAALMYAQGASLPVVAGLLLWSVLVISTADNILRPIFISRSTRIPLLLVLLGLVGGVLGFGPPGLFLGPAIMAVVVTLWREGVRHLERHRVRGASGKVSGVTPALSPSCR